MSARLCGWKEQGLASRPAQCAVTGRAQPPLAAFSPRGEEQRASAWLKISTFRGEAFSSPRRPIPNSSTSCATCCRRSVGAGIPAARQRREPPANPAPAASEFIQTPALRCFRSRNMTACGHLPHLPGSGRCADNGGLDPAGARPRRCREADSRSTGLLSLRLGCADDLHRAKAIVAVEGNGRGGSRLVGQPGSPLMLHRSGRLGTSLVHGCCGRLAKMPKNQGLMLLAR